MSARHESRHCLPEFQERITRLFGKNVFGSPNYKIEWSQSVFIRQGNLWRDKHGNERVRYIDRYLCATPCWCLYKWFPASHYGHPDLFYQQNYDSLTGLSYTGEYPWKGRYEILQAFFSKEFVKDKLEISIFPLSHILIDKIIPLIAYVHSMNKEQKNAAKELNRQYEEKKRKAEINEITDRMMESLPVWYDTVSYTRQGVKTSLLTRKMDQIQKTWDRWSKRGKTPHFQPGFAVGERPRIVPGRN